jgi:hypothetical protein
MDSFDIKVYTTTDHPRLEYILSVILGSILGLNYVVITDRRKTGLTPVINYSNEMISGSFKVPVSGLLSQSVVNKMVPGSGEWKDLPVLFPSETDSDIPFDIFAASFFLVSRYEEYTEEVRDRHGRYPAEASTAFRLGFLDRPVVDLWTKQLALRLIMKFPFLAFRSNHFTSMASFDIDQAFAYRGKGFFRGAAGLVSDIVKGEGIERIRSVSGNAKDPFDVYDYIFDTIRSNNTRALFFLPFGSWSEFDKNSHSGSRLYQALISRITDSFEAGIHFSYNSGKDHSLMMRETDRYRTITGVEPECSRQHYLLLSFPSTYRALIENKIKCDYTMGYASCTGFRAGIARPFRFYDLQAETETDLIINPFQLMDVTLRDYLKLTPEGAMKVADNLIAETRAAGGQFISIWHNSNLTERDGWEGWREVLEYILLKSRQQ